MNDLLLLSTLLAGPQHGYALKKQVGLISGQGQMHNNLVYPLLRRFVKNSWVTKRQAAGKRGQIREVYALSAKGKRELLRRLAEFTEKEALSESAFHLRVGLFAFLDSNTQEAILAERDRWLALRQEKLANLQAAIDLGKWGGAVVAFRRQQIAAERHWISKLKRRLHPNESHK
jgi:DNA-binding PadR family transcriptional regulator